MSIEEYFSKANSLQEIYKVARELKADGYDVALVNAAATARKQELIEASGTINRLKKFMPNSGTINRSSVTQFPISVNNVNAPYITVSSSQIIL